MMDGFVIVFTHSLIELDQIPSSVLPGPRKAVLKNMNAQKQNP